MRRSHFRSWVALSVLGVVVACSSSDQLSGPLVKPEFAISDAVHGGGTAGFYFLAPMVAQPSTSGTVDADIGALNPTVAICDITGGLDTNCGDASGTPAAIVFTATTTPAIGLDPTASEFQVNWDTKGTPFLVGHTYRLHVGATDVCGHRKQLGFADVLLMQTPGQVKQLATGDSIVLQDGRTLPVHFRVETQAVSVTEPHDCWTSVASMPTPRADPSVAAVNGKLYVIGGFALTPGSCCTPVAAVEAYDPVSNTWSTLAPLPIPRVQPGVGVVNGIIYVVGGSIGDTQLATVEAYDPATNEWTTKHPMNAPRYFPAVGVVNGILYVAAGTAANTDIQTVEAYDPSTDQWTIRQSLMTDHGRTSGGGVVNGLFFVAGGDGAASRTVDAYDPAADSWNAKTSLLYPGLDLGVGTVNNIMYAVGDIEPTQVQAYDPAADIWTTKQPLRTPRFSVRVSGLNGLLYAVGGYGVGYLVNGNQDPTAIVEVYHP